MGGKKTEPTDNNDKEVLELQNTILDLNKELDELKLKQEDYNKLKKDLEELKEKYDNVTKLNSELLIKNTKLSNLKSNEVKNEPEENNETLTDFIKNHFNENKGE